MFHFFSGLNPFTPKSDLMYVDFTLSNARRFSGVEGKTYGIRIISIKQKQKRESGILSQLNKFIN